VESKLVQRLGTPSTRVAPDAVQATPVPTLREAGLSQRKAEYLLDLAHHFRAGTVHVQQWRPLCAA